MITPTLLRQVSNPNGVNLHRAILARPVIGFYGFKPQRGKFTPVILRKSSLSVAGFKPQRGKFTPCHSRDFQEYRQVSNPNGVNLHE